MLPLEDLRGQLAQVFRQPGVRLAYLFGSHAEGRARPDSDVDFAILVPHELSVAHRFELQTRIMGDLMKLLDAEDVDVQLLNAADPLFRMEVLRNGTLLFAESDEHELEFAVATHRDYFDAQHAIAIMDEAYRRRLTTGEFGRRATPLLVRD